MDRREFLAAAGGMASTLVSTAAMASTGMFEGKPEGLSDLFFDDKTDEKILKQLAVVRQKAFECVAAGYACIQHCQQELIAGHAKDFAECTFTAHQMVSICQNTGTLAAYKAKAIADFLKGCIAACERCKVACEAHKSHFAHDHHLECRDCMESCKACAQECKTLLAML